MSDWLSGQIDVLVVTALRDEYQAVLEVQDGALPGSSWDIRPGPTKLDVAFRTFLTAEGTSLQVAVTRPLEKGREHTANAIAPLVTHYRPLCLAMCGICAGRRGEVEQGDVIIASRLWSYDIGAVKVETDASGQRVERFWGESLSYNIPPAWLQKAETFSPPAGSWLSTRPLVYAPQMDWMLERILQGDDPGRHDDRKVRCPDYQEVLKLLWKRGWLQPDSLNLTSSGRQHIERQRLLHPAGLPGPAPFTVRVGPIGTGGKVVRDPRIFELLAERERKLLGLEMEASAIGAIAHLHEVPYVAVIKGVNDFADEEKDDHFRSFAARASAECLLAFVRAHLPSGEVPEVRHGRARVSALDFQDVLEPGTSKPPANPSPSALLDARHGFIPFFEEGRAGLLQDLRAWCDKEEPVGAWLLHGVGGIGKTRLLIEWSERLAREEWWTGFLVKSVDLTRFEELLSSAPRLLVVIDYAESRQSLGALLQLVARRRNTRHDGRLRLVLLARTAGEWWQELLASESPVKDLLSDKPPKELAALVAAGPDRARVFEEAVQQFASLRGGASRKPVLRFEDRRFDRILYLHMAALATVEGLSFTADSLMDEILDHEERFWLTQAPVRLDAERRLFKERVRRMVTAFTLRGGVSGRREAEAVLSRVNGAHDDALLLLLRDLYPGNREGAGSAYVSGLEPDLLGEAMTLRTLRKQADLAGQLLERVFEDASEGTIRTGFEVLGRLSVDHAEETERWIAGLLEHDLMGRAVAALEAAKAVGLRTAHSSMGMPLASALERQGTVELAERLDAAGLPKTTVILREVGLWAAQMLLRHLADNESPEALVRRVRLLNLLSLRQRDLRKLEDSLASIKEAVGHCRKLEDLRPGAFSTELAGCLHNLGITQSALGRREESLATVEESVAIRRTLAAAQPDAFLLDLANGLSVLSTMQSNLNKPVEALASTQEAVAYLRKLVQERPERFLPALAGILMNQAATHDLMGQPVEALASAQEAADHYRKLVESSPDTFLPDLAGSLNNLGLMLGSLKRHEEALRPAQESVEIRRKLAQVRPGAFLPDLARSLHSLSTRQQELKLRQEALASAREAVAIRRQLAEERPDAIRPYLADSLTNLCNRQRELGMKECLDTAEEALTLYRQLAQARPEAFRQYLAIGLNALSNAQHERRMKEEALASIQEALNTIWPSFLTVPSAFKELTETILKNMDERLKAMGRAPDPELLGRWQVFKARTAQ